MMLASPAVSVIEDASMYDDYVTIGGIPPVEIYQGSNATFCISVTNHGNLCYDVNLAFDDLPDGITVYPVETQTIDTGMTVEYQITIHASEDAPAGTHTIGIADNSADDPYTWHDAAVSVQTPPPPPTPAPTERVMPIARGIPTRPTEDVDGAGKRETGTGILFWAIAIVGVILGIAAFMRYKRM